MSQKAKMPTTKLMLSLLAQTGQTLIDYYNFFQDLKFNRGYYLRGGHTLVKEMNKLHNEQTIKKTMRQLQRRNYLKIQKTGQRLIISLTKKGLNNTLALQLDKAPQRADKLSTVVIFDIPQSQSAARRQFRWLLRQGGFKKLQQSVWISQKDNYHIVVKFIKDIKLTPWVNVFRARDFLINPK